MKKREMDPLPDGWAPGADYDSRGPGKYCARCNTWNPANARACRACGWKP